MRRIRIAGAVALLLTTMVATGGPAFAAAPANDTYLTSTAVSLAPFTDVASVVPFTDEVSTVEATDSTDDGGLNEQCGAPAFGASVWYEVTPASDTGVIVDVSGSDYSAGVAIATGSPGNWTVLTCGPGAVGWSASAGETYSVIAFDDTQAGADSGGNLNIRMEAAPPTPTIGVTVDPTATFNAKTGAATVSGTVTCSGQAEFAFMDVQLSQKVGRLIVRGYGGTEVTCDGEDRPWTVVVPGYSGTFAGGKALSVTFGVACGMFDCGIDYQERNIMLRGGRA